MPAVLGWHSRYSVGLLLVLLVLVRSQPVRPRVAPRNTSQACSCTAAAADPHTPGASTGASFASWPQLL